VRCSGGAHPEVKGRFDLFKRGIVQAPARAHPVAAASASKAYARVYNAWMMPRLRWWGCEATQLAREKLIREPLVDDKERCRL